MTFTTPIHLLLLLPWAGVVVWVLMGRADFARVSTTQFWDRTETTSKTRRGIRKPPLAMVLLLGAALSGILAAGGMNVRWGTSTDELWIVDRNVESFAALERDEALRERLFGKNAHANVTLVPESNVVLATGEETSAKLHAAIARAVATTDRQVMVVTSKRLAVDASRVSVVSPRGILQNAGIERLAVVEAPSPQAMVRVWNGTAKAQATLRVGSAERVIELPERGASKDYFVDLPEAPEWLGVELVMEDDIAADNRAYAAKRGAWPGVEARASVLAGVGRLIEVYQRTRPTSPGAPVVTIVNDITAPGPSIVLAMGSDKAEGAIRAEDHPVTRDVDWTLLADLIRASTNRIAPGGKALVWVGKSPVVVELADRRLWIGFDLAAIAQRPEFVVFFTNAIDFVGAGKPVYASEPARVLEDSWKRVDTGSLEDMDAAPGVYRTQDRLLAMNIEVAKPDLSELPQPEAGTRNRVISSQLPMGGALLAVSLGLVLGAVLRLTRS